jgi:geranylgeranyl diphosphate synthase type I
MGSQDFDSAVASRLEAMGYEATQSASMTESLIVVDAQDKVLGEMAKLDCHLGDGVLHRAFSVLLFDENDRLLVQKRAGEKITFPFVWANTCCSHPLNIDSERGSDGAKTAAVRKMAQELGIVEGDVPIGDIHLITRMVYRARQDDEWVEHELDHILFARTNSDLHLSPNPNEISELRWISRSELAGWLNHGPDDGGVIAPWFRCIAEEILPEWWSNLSNLPAMADDKIRNMGDVSHVMGYQDGVEASDEDLMDTLAVHRVAVERRVVTALSRSESDTLRSAMLHLIEGGGKRLRAILPWLVADSLEGAHDGHYDLGAAIEIIHNFTLVHDDIMDNDAVRRGRPAVHVAFDEPTAINAGDAMLAVSFEVLASSDNIDSEHFRTLVQIIGGMVRKVSEGQQMDMSFENMESVNESQYLGMISGKTAAMFTTCASAGALLAGADSNTISTLAEWGENVGLCFQLIDDLIDVTGDSATLGKPACSDVIAGKRTLIAIHASEQDSSKLVTFEQAFGSENDSYDRDTLDIIVNELENSGSIPYAREKAMEFHAAAHASLDRLPQTAGIKVLRALTDFQLTRIS